MTVDESEFIKSTEFKGSFPSLQQCPETKLPEFAFIGRSNVGKSSLINLLVRNKKMAKVSGTPGKTQLINFFEINQSWYLVDLPGYGYAKVSKTARVGFKKMIYDYLEKRPQIRNVFVLIDSRVPTQKQDLDFINWLGSKSIPFIIIFTKTDGLKSIELKEKVATFGADLLEYWEELPFCITSSAKKKIGRKEILLSIQELLY